jgi:hypothetical protein
MTAPSASMTEDQAFLPSFRATLIAQAAAGLVFGLAPLLLQAPYASTLGFSGDDVLVYRLGGAATTGYFVAPVVALAWRAGWAEIRIPAIATLTFTIGAFGASVWELFAGARQLVVPFVVVAGAVFTVIALYWWRRDTAAGADPGRPIPQVGRAILALATISAGLFGLLPLLVPALFASLFGLAGTDTWVFRLAGAGCLGYATAGIASLMAPGYRPMRIQNMAAITFNVLGAASAWVAVVSGDGGLLAPVVAAAASFFSVALIWMDRRLAS